MQESRAITRKSASNLALAFILLPREKRDAMSALYAFCREVDDVADDESVPAPNGSAAFLPGARISVWLAPVADPNSRSIANFSRSSSITAFLSSTLTN